MTNKRPRRALTVSMLPELYERAKAAAAKRDIPVTAWVREIVEAELRKRD